jgi:hypothetical protein
MKEINYSNMYDNQTNTYAKNQNSQRIVPNNDVEVGIMNECLDFADFLIKKNRAYGNSALNPCRIMSKADTLEQLYVRIDDKLNRLMNGSDYPGDNDIQDLIGYLILLQVAKKGIAK